MLDPAKTKELEADIATLEIGQLTPQTYEKLMILKAVKFFDDLESMGGVERLMGATERTVYSPGKAETHNSVETHSSSDFLLAVSGKDSTAAWDVMDDLMSSLQQVNVKVYESIMRKIRAL